MTVEIRYDGVGYTAYEEGRATHYPTISQFHGALRALVGKEVWLILSSGIKFRLREEVLADPPFLAREDARFSVMLPLRWVGTSVECPIDGSFIDPAHPNCHRHQPTEGCWDLRALLRHNPNTKRFFMERPWNPHRPWLSRQELEELVEAKEEDNG